MERKNNNLVLILMGVIIVILVVLCVLFATGTFSLKDNNSNNKVNSQEVGSESEINSDINVNNNEKKIINAYYGWFMEKGYSSALVLFNDNSFEKCERYDCLKGTFKKENNKLSLVTDSTEVYPTSMSYNYTIESVNGESKLISEDKNSYTDLTEMSKSNIIKAYYGYYSNNSISYSTLLVLYDDNTFEEGIRYDGIKGTFKLEDNKLSLVTDSTEKDPVSVHYNYTLESSNNENSLISEDKSKYSNLKEIK